MGTYFLKRLLLTIPVVAGVSVMLFIIMNMIPGDAAEAVLGPYATPENVKVFREEMGLDKPLPEQYLIWAGKALQGDLGHSSSLERPVLDEVLERLGPTALLVGTALSLSTILGLLTGIISAIRQYQWQDKLLTILVLLGLSAPSFWLGLVLVMFFSLNLQWFPVSGMFAPYSDETWPDLLHHLVLPVTTLTIVTTGIISRMMRTNMLEVLRHDFVRTARAKGLPERVVLYKHAFRNAVVSVVPVIGAQIGFVIGGAVYIEVVFQWPGIGQMMVAGILERDIILVQGAVLFISTLYVLLNLVTDLIQSLLDPRISV